MLLSLIMQPMGLLLYRIVLCAWLCKVHARILSQPILWVIHTNKHGSIQLLGQCIVPYEIYHPISRIHCLLYFMRLYAYFVLK